MTKNEIDGLLLKYVFKEDIDTPPKWYYENFWLETLLCNSWPGLGLVVEEMLKRGWWPCLDKIANGWCAIFSLETGRVSLHGITEAGAEALTPFMAVAIAALRAVGVEIPEEEALNGSA